MTRGKKPSGKTTGKKTGAAKTARPVSKSAPKAGGAAGGSRPVGNRSKTDGKLHIQPGSFRKPKTDSRPAPVSRRRADDSAPLEGEAPPTQGSGAAPRGPGPRGTGSRSAGPGGAGSGSTASRSTGVRPARRPNPPRLRGPQLDAPPPTTTFRDRDGKPHTFPDSALKRVAAQILSEKNKRWRYRPFGFPIFSPSGNEQELHFDFYVYDNMDQVIRLILLMPRESREVWDRVGRFKQQYPMYHYELWTPDTLAKILAPRGGLGW